MPRPREKLTFYVDTECSFHHKNRCSYYSSKKTQKQAAQNAKQAWSTNCCPIVYVKINENKFTAFCPTEGGPYGEQLPTFDSPGPGAVKVEVKPRANESWAKTIERAARKACETKS